MRTIWLINFNIQISIISFQNDTLWRKEDCDYLRLFEGVDSVLVLFCFHLLVCVCSIVLSWIVSEVEIINISRGAPETWLTRLIRLQRSFWIETKYTILILRNALSINLGFYLHHCKIVYSNRISLPQFCIFWKWNENLEVMKKASFWFS